MHMALPDVRDIGRRRKAAGMTQKELALRAGISQSLVAKIEAGSVQPSYEIVRRIFGVFDELGRATEVRAKDIMSRDVATIPKSSTVGRAADTMRRLGYSQLPVTDGTHVVGMITEKTMLDVVAEGRSIAEIMRRKVESVMDDAPPMVGENEPIASLSGLLQNNAAVLVAKGMRTVGIIAKSDLFKIAKK
jgi:predicted transcriptional regulator